MIGGDLLYDDYKFNVDTINQKSLLYPNKNEKETISAFSSVMLLLCSGISNDPLYMSYSFQAGIIQSALLCFIAVILTQTSFHIFVKTWRFNQENSYISIWNDCFNKETSFIPKIFLLGAFIILSCVTTIDALGQYDHLMATWASNSNAWYTSQTFAKYIISFVFTVPMMLHKSFSSMRFMAMIGNLLLVVCIICELVLFIKNVKENGFDPQKKIVYWGKDFNMTVSCFSLFNIVFFSHPFVAMLSEDIHQVNRTKVCKITWATSVVSAILNLAGGYLGYLTFFGNQQDDIIFYSYDNQKNVFVVIGTVCCLIKTMLSNSIFVYICAIELFNLFYPYKNTFYFERLFSGLVIWTLAICVSYGSDLIKDGILSILTDFTFTILAFILPSVIFLGMFKFKMISFSIISILEIIVCLTIGVILLRSSIKSFIDSYVKN